MKVARGSRLPTPPGGTVPTTGGRRPSTPPTGNALGPGWPPHVVEDERRICQLASLAMEKRCIGEAPSHHVECCHPSRARALGVHGRTGRQFRRVVARSNLMQRFQRPTKVKNVVEDDVARQAGSSGGLSPRWAQWLYRLGPPALGTGGPRTHNRRIPVRASRGVERKVPSKTFQVTTYVVNVGYKNIASWGGVTIQIQGYAACFGADGSRLIVYGLHPNSPVPSSPVYNVAGNVGAIFVPFRDLPVYVDILRNEKPIYARLDSDNPNWISLSTSQEPVGEEEAI
jgi:hypothetical protein